MFSRLRSCRPSHATVVAYLALFVALGGTAYAAATIGSGQIVDNSIRSVDVRNDSSSGGGLRSADIVESSLGRVANADRLDGKDSRGFARLRRAGTINVSRPALSSGTCSGLKFQVIGVRSTDLVIVNTTSPSGVNVTPREPETDFLKVEFCNNADVAVAGGTDRLNYQVLEHP